MLITTPFRSLRCFSFRDQIRHQGGRGQRPRRSRRRAVATPGRLAEIEQVEPRVLLAAAITVGSHNLLPDTAGQTISILATGDSDVTGLNVRAQLGDGIGAMAEPVFDGISYAGSIWTGSTTETGGPINGAEQFLQSSVVFNDSGTSVVSSGQVFQLSIDTTGFTSGTFALNLSMTDIGADTAFVLAGGVEEAISITNGSITVGSVDETTPTVTVNIVDASLNDGDNASDVTFEFSEDVTGFDASDVSVSGGTLSNFAAVDGDSFTATFTADDDTEATGSVSVGTGYTDAAGNTGTAGSDNVSIDTRNPTVTVNIVDASLNDGDNASDVTFEFSEDVTGFDASDVSVSGGTLSNFAAVDGDSFTATFTADDELNATGSVSVGTGYTDAAGNAGTAGSDTVAINTVSAASAAIIVGSHNLLPNTAGQTINIIASGDLDVTGLNVRAQLGDGSGAMAEPVFDGISYAGSIWTGSTTETGGPIGGAEQFLQSSVVFNDSGTSVVSSGQVFQLSIDTTGFTSGTFALNLSMTEIGADTAFVLAGGVEEAISITNGSITIASIDETPPTVTVSFGDTSLSDSDNSSQVTFEFSEDVTGFDANDVSVSGGTLSNFTAVDGDSFTATFTADDGIEANGSVSVGTGYTDIAGNNGTAGSDIVSIDTLNPSLTITPDGIATPDTPVTFTFQFSEAVTGFDAGDVSLTGASAGTFIAVDGDTYTLAVSPAAAGDVTVSVAADAAQDLAGNGSGAAAAAIVFQEPLEVVLPGGGGPFEVLRDGADLVVRIEGGAELARQRADTVRFVNMIGSADADVVTVLDTGTPVDTGIVFTGGDGNDRFDASLSVGNTILTGNGGDDVMIGGSGNDTLNGGSGKDEVIGNAGDDLVQGQGSTGDTLDGGDGNDTLNGGNGNDLIRESFPGDATLTNSLMTGRGTDTIIGAERAMFTGGGAAQTFDLSAFFVPGLTSTILDGGGGDDTILATSGGDIISGAGGSDLIDAGGGDDRVFGGSGADTIAGGNGNDFIKGLGGSGDQLIGGAGNDTLNGGRGVDRVIESRDADFTVTNTSMTGNGTDVLLALEIAEINAGDSDNLIDVSDFLGFRGFVQVRAFGGNDTILGSAGPDVLNGGDGNDSLVGGEGDDLLNGDAGNDILQGKEGDDTLNGGDDNDGLSGFTGNDVLNGERGFDRAFGGNGNDTLTGGNARDTLFGGAGDDSLAGNDGDDTLVGGTGNNDASPGDVFDGLASEIDEAFMLDSLPGWVDQV